MSTIKHMNGFETPAQDAIERGIAQGRRLHAEAIRGTLASLFSRRKDDETRSKSEHLPEGAAPA
ncbi:MAG: hypothetical protein AAF543_16070 [Pseudomonadota bacterium]